MQSATNSIMRYNRVSSHSLLVSWRFYMQRQRHTFTHAHRAQRTLYIPFVTFSISMRFAYDLLVWLPCISGCVSKFADSFEHQQASNWQLHTLVWVFFLFFIRFPRFLHVRMGFIVWCIKFSFGKSWKEQTANCALSWTTVFFLLVFPPSKYYMFLSTFLIQCHVSAYIYLSNIVHLFVGWVDSGQWAGRSEWMCSVSCCSATTLSTKLNRKRDNSNLLKRFMSHNRSNRIDTSRSICFNHSLQQQ